MNKVFLILFLLACCLGCQNNSSKPDAGPMLTLSRDSYLIKYPDNWKIDTSHAYGVDVFIASPKESATDKFVENVNVLVQQLPSDTIHLDQYVAISERQITEMAQDGELIHSTKATSNGLELQAISFYHTQGPLRIRADQYYFVRGTKAYVVTFSMQKDKEADFSAVAKSILNSFSLR